MDVSEGALWFSDSALAGWNGSAWVPDVAYGDFHVYDRFITEREFGATKRVFLAPEDSKLDASTYPVVKTVDGSIWIVESINPDYLGDSTYQHTYLLVISTGVAQVYSRSSTARASGAPGDLVATLQATTWAKVSHFGGEDSERFDDVRRGLFEITLPNGIAVGPDSLVKVDGTSYEVEEVYEVLHSSRVRARKYDG